jgi:hypothetical protein
MGKQRKRGRSLDEQIAYHSDRLEFFERGHTERDRSLARREKRRLEALIRKKEAAVK